MSPYKRGSKWYVEWPDERGKRKRKSSKARTEKEAEIIEAELRVGSFRAKEGLGPGSRNPTRLTLQEAADKKLAKMKGRGSYESLKNAMAKHITRSGLGDLLLEHVTTAVIEKYLDTVQVTLRQRGKTKTEGDPTPATLNRLRSMFSGIFRLMKKQKLYFGENPVTDVDQRPEPEHTDDRMIDPARIHELLEDAPDEDWRLVFALAAYAGLRRGDIAQLDLVEHCDLQKRVLTVVKGKDPRNGGKIRRVGIHLELVPLIQAAIDRGFDLRTRNWSQSAKKVREALGGDDVDGVFHGLRNTWASQLEECDAKESVVDYMGWGRRKGNVRKKHYLDFPANRLTREIDKLVYPRPADDSNQTEENSAQTRHTLAKGTQS